ncbi:MAG: hypothetical protein KF888_10220 [Nitrosomonas sp.]|nr:hypothetical protein [Nitrosomonas sp.]
MYTSFVRACVVLLVFILSISAHAAGLGKLTINSALGQPFNAEIDLVTVNVEDLSSLNASIASLEAYAQAGIQYEPFFPTFKLSIEPRANGEPYIRIASPQAINEPFINLLIELNWASGRLLREYTILLDPVDTRRPEPVSPIVRAVPEEPVNSVNSAAMIMSSPAAQSTAAISYEQPRQSIPVPTSRLTENRSNTYGPVLQGDTLSSIARQVKPEGVNVNQMLVALFRANREAFIANNMNLLRTGAVLKIPDIEELDTISRQQADAEVKLQVSDWQKYRQNLALATQQTQGYETLKQVDSGQITTTVADTAVTSRDDSQEVLRLSSGENLLGSADAQASQSAAERLRMMEEDAIARSMALKEANERIAMLEKNIGNLQKLLALQNSELAKAQTNVQAQSPSSVSETPSIITQQDSSTHSAMESIEVLTPEPDIYHSEFDLLSELVDGDFDFEESVSTELTVSDIATTSDGYVPPVTNPLVQQEPEEPSFIGAFLGQAMDNLIYIGAALIILPLLVLGIKIRNERKDDKAMADEEARFEENAAALRNKAAAAVATTHVAASHATDNVEEDLDIFGQDSDFLHGDHAEMGGQVETAEDPSSGDQSLALDFSKEIANSNEESLSQPVDDNSDFDLPESVAHAPISDQSFDEITTDDLNESIEAERAGHDADSDNHLLDFPENESPQSDEESAYALNIDFDASGESSENLQLNEVEALEIDLTDDSVKLDSKNVPVESGEESDIEDSLDFSIDPSTIDLSDENPSSNKSFSPASDGDTSTSDLLDSNTLQFEMQESGEAEDKIAGKPTEIDFSDIDLDFDSAPDNQSTGISEESSPIVDTDAKNEQWHEVETKIDLAKAYLDMEDKEGAREMLEEVIQEGDTRQQETAKALLKDL